jgi:predicted nucleotidyltransferase
MDWVEEHTIFRTLTGSRVYGTHHEGSDYDYRGVCIPPARYWLGYNSRFEQWQADDEDLVIFGFKKFLDLAAANNPNIIELLFIPSRYWKKWGREWERTLSNRALFVSKKCFHTFSGYAHSQLRRMRSHREWLTRGEMKEPTRADFNLVDRRQLPTETINAAKALIERNLDWLTIEEELAQLPKDSAMALRQRVQEFLEHAFCLTYQEINDVAWISSGVELGFADNFLEMLQQEKQYQRARREYQSWQKWKKERNPRRKEAEEKYGYDVKHAMHLVRLLLMCKEILQTGEMQVERSDAKDVLIPIKNGEWSYGKLLEFEADMNAELEKLYETSTLQHSPKRDEIEALGIHIIESYFEWAPR